MKFLDKKLTSKEIDQIKKEYGCYLKVTADIENGWLVIGGELHADGERLLLDKSSRQDDIWGGGINLEEKIIDTTAVLNIRPKLGNDSLEILDPEIRSRFTELVKEIFAELWS